MEDEMTNRKPVALDVRRFLWRQHVIGPLWGIPVYEDELVDVDSWRLISISFQPFHTWRWEVGVQIVRTLRMYGVVVGGDVSPHPRLIDGAPQNVRALYDLMHAARAEAIRRWGGAG